MGRVLYIRRNSCCHLSCGGHILKKGKKRFFWECTTTNFHFSELPKIEGIDQYCCNCCTLASFRWMARIANIIEMASEYGKSPNLIILPASKAYAKSVTDLYRFSRRVGKTFGQDTENVSAGAGCVFWTGPKSKFSYFLNLSIRLLAEICLLI